MTRRVAGVPERSVNRSAIEPIPIVGFPKRYEAMVEIEWEKAEQLNRLGSVHGFVAPAVLAIDRGAQVITYEKLDALVPLRTVYLEFTTNRKRGERIPELFGEAGRVLANLHRDLTMRERVGWTVPSSFEHHFTRRSGRGTAELLGRTPHAVLHGDFGFGNVHVVGDQARLVVLDPSPNHYLTLHPSTWASIYLDIGLFVACLHGLVGVRHFALLRRDRIAELERAFLRGYESGRGEALDLEMVDVTAYAIAGTYLGVRYRLPLVAGFALRLMFLRP